MISNEDDLQWDILRPPQVHYCRGCWCIRGGFHDKFLGFLGFGFRRKLLSIKTQQGIEKTSEHNGRTLFLRALIFLTCESTGVMSTSSYHLSSIYYNSSQFTPTSLFASASATNRVRLHRQITPPPTTEYVVSLVQTGMQKHITASPPQPLKKANMMMTTYPDAADLSANHRASE